MAASNERDAGYPLPSERGAPQEGRWLERSTLLTAALLVPPKAIRLATQPTDPADRVRVLRDGRPRLLRRVCN